MKFLAVPLVAAALGMLSLSAAAQQPAITAKSVNLRAGPDRGYPIVAVLPPNAQVMVEGCMPDYRWCDVSIGYDRGWVYAGNLSYLYQQGYVPLPSIAPVIGVVVLGFVLDDYWGRHYQGRPWYPQRGRWEAFDRSYPVHPRPAPNVHPAPRPHVGPPGRPGQPEPRPQQRPERPQRRDAPPQVHQAPTQRQAPAQVQPPPQQRQGPAQVQQPRQQRQGPAQVHQAPPQRQAPPQGQEGQDRREGGGERH